MKKIITDYFDMKYNVSYNGIITDIPYKGCIRGKLGEEDFDIIEFLYKADNDTLTDSFLITFCNMRCLIDIVNACNLSNWTYHTYQIWDKSPTRNWISWAMPLRTTEYIVYLKKGKYKYCFKDGTENPAYKRPLNGIHKIMKDLIPKGRKITLNFAVADYEIDPQILLKYFDPKYYICKLTPMHKTSTALKNDIKTKGDYTSYYSYKYYERALLRAGYDVIVFIASKEEDLSRITCGNAILSGKYS